MGLIITHPSLQQNIKVHSTVQSEVHEQRQSSVKQLFLSKDY